MAQFFKAKPNRSKKLSAKLSLEVTQLDHLGAGMAEHEGKWVFIPGALPGERVQVQLIEQKKNYARAKLLQIESASAARMTPPCPHYAECGGCDMQHLSLEAQRSHKAAALEDIMARSTGVGSGAMADILTPALVADGWHYRRRARLATLLDKDSQQLQLGFRAEASKAVVPISQCPVLAKALSDLIAPLAVVLNRLKGKQRLGHVELIEVDNGRFLVLRITAPLVASDRHQLQAFAEEHKISLLFVDNDGELEYLHGEARLPSYQLEQGKLSLAFAPGNFIQVNGAINQAMVQQAMDWLDIQPGERVLDLFCGVGNFSLPLASRGAEVIGVEGVTEMVLQARMNAADNGFESLRFFGADLSADLSTEPWLGKIDKLLLDPARAGAYESLKWLKKMKPTRVLYVSCNPSSLARDSALLLDAGYRLTRLGLVDMFPQTHHSEAMALFELEK